MFWLHQGVHGLYPNGSTGEFTRLTEEERRTIARITCEEAKGRVPVLAGPAGRSRACAGAMIQSPPICRPDPDLLARLERMGVVEGYYQPGTGTGHRGGLRYQLKGGAMSPCALETSCDLDCKDPALPVAL